MFDFTKFAGDVKVGWSLFGKLEKKAINYFVPKIPKSIEGYHLTLSSIIWCLFIIVFSYMAANYDIRWMWATSLMIFAQYITDSLDGSLGRFRDTGIPKWGYYMDHFLDYIFLCSILIGYSFLFNDKFNTLFFILAIFGAFMVNSYLYFSVTNKFKIEYLGIGPTEIRFIFIVINALLIFFHKTYMIKLLPAVLLFSLAGLIYVVYRSQKEIWKIDMAAKNTSKNEP
jgi:archaetidylinositol phosphate synthase